MIFTTRIKIFLKNALPQPLFQIVHKNASTILTWFRNVIFSVQTRMFKEKTIKEVTYNDHSFQIVIDPKNGFLDRQIFIKKLYEPHIVKEFVENITKSNICIDIGANIGHHTIIMAQQAGAEGHVYAFEPIPYIRAQMEESLSLNNLTNVTTIPNALSDAEGSLSLHINPSNIAGSSLVNDSSGEEITVHVRTLDSHTYPKVNFIKIDVEGFEYQVLLGGKETIAKHRPKILFEFSPLYYHKNNPEHTLKILEFFQNLHYTMRDLEDGEKIVTDTVAFSNEFGEGLRSQTNILALPQ